MSESYPCQPPKCIPLVTKEKKIAPARKRKHLPSRPAPFQGEIVPRAQNWRLSPLPRLSHAISVPQIQRGASNQLGQYDLAPKVRESCFFNPIIRGTRGRPN